MADITVYVTGATATGTPGTDGATYQTLQAAITGEAGAVSDFDTRAGILNIEIQWTGNDTTAVSVTGFTNVSATQYINIYTAAAARNTAGPWSESYYRLTRSVASSRPLTILTSYTRVTGLQMASTHASGATGPIAISGNTINVLIDRCRIYNNTTGTGLATSPIYLYSGTTNSVTVRNSVIYGSTYGTAGVVVATGNTCTIENCTIYVPNAAYAIYKSATTNVYNTYLGGPTDTIYQTLTVASKVATSDDSGSEADLRGIVASTTSGAFFTNITPGSEDFTIGVSSALKNVGATLGTLTEDIRGTARDSLYDIGAFEYVSSSQYGRPSLDAAAGTWTNELGASTDLHESINETAADLSDLDYIRSAASPSDDTFVTELSGIVNPGSGTVTMRVRARTV